MFASLDSQPFVLQVYAPDKGFPMARTGTGLHKRPPRPAVTICGPRDFTISAIPDDHSVSLGDRVSLRRTTAHKPCTAEKKQRKRVIKSIVTFSVTFAFPSLAKGSFVESAVGNASDVLRQPG